VRGLAELLLCPRHPQERDDGPVILGSQGVRPLRVSLRQVRHAVLDMGLRLSQRGIAPGDTVCLVRLPRTSEAVCAVAYAALSAWGYRVLLPMYLERERLGRWLDRTGARAVLWDAAEVTRDTRNQDDLALVAGLRDVAHAHHVPVLCLEEDLDVAASLRAEHAASPLPGDPRVRALVGGAGPPSGCLVLTTSGSTGQARLVTYTQDALVRGCMAWEAAGLFAPHLLGGRGLTLLFAHSMGVRAFWNAVWTRQPLCLVTPEWFLEKPECARALLLSMLPEHVTGGPATFRALLELARVFPDLKDGCLRALRCAVSTGAPFDVRLARLLASSLGIRLANAFGMTETMQVCTTLLGGAEDRGPAWLGEPLPGARLGLERVPGVGEHLYRLHVASPWGCAAFLEDDEAGQPVERPAPAWVSTGDIVEEAGTGLCHVAREAEDFCKDGFGLKVPLGRVRGFYLDLGDGVDHVEVFPLREEPGLAALVFLPGTAGAAGTPGLVQDRAVLDRVRSLVEARHEELRTTLEDMELRHFTVTRLACVGGPAPRTAKGTPDHGAVRLLAAPFLDALTGRYVASPAMVRLEDQPGGRSSSARLVSPRRGELMRLAKLDKHYVRGRGDRLTWEDHGSEVEVVDFVGGFGATLLGHRHPEVVAAAAEFAGGDGVFLADQGSARLHQGELARRLALLVGRETGRHCVVCLASTGAEAVEMALAHAVLERDEAYRKLQRDLRAAFGSSHPGEVARLQRHNQALLCAGRPKVLAVAGGFHGHSAGARGLLSHAKKREPFRGMLGVEAIFLPPDGEVDLPAMVEAERIPIRTLQREGGGVVEVEVPFSRIVASVAEPVQGEGGVREVSRRLLHALAAQPFPLVLDEIQSGLGRCGEVLASRGVAGSYYVFSKGLGGGVAKVAALMVDRHRYVPRFDELYSSTFAGDAYSCHVACRVLDVLERDDVPRRARERGAVLRGELEAVQESFPDVVREVRGRGLLLGVELDPRAVEGHFLLRAAVDRELYGVLAAAYLLNRHRVRLLPTLSAPLVLRVEPSAYVDDGAVAALGRGLRAFCHAVRTRDLAQLLGFLVEEEQGFPDTGATEGPLPGLRTDVEPPSPQACRVAFLAHFIHPEREIAMAEPSLRALSRTARRALVNRLVGLFDLKAATAFGRNLFGGRVHFTALNLAADAATLEELHRSASRGEIVERIQEAVDLAAARGCTALALGAFTSILTADGTAVMPPPGLKVTSGNTLTVAVAVRRLLRACQERGIRPEETRTTLAVVGATGNIGSGLVERLLRPGLFQAAVLVGRDQERLERLRARLLGQAPGLHLSVATDMGALREAHVVVMATAAAQPLVYPQHLATAHPVVVVDVAVPGALAEESRKLPHVLAVPLSGTVTVPGEPDFVASSHTEPGTTFACAAEVMLCGLEPQAIANLRLVGPVDAHAVEVLDGLAEKHGFYTRLGDLGPVSPG
jgi:acetylornithine/succinyldiaminopimelate/putrescine aminotransferase/predicted amino acid dehydrogenase/acyl-coenzyme A synthetase/AMP-(fatty) acid ligase